MKNHVVKFIRQADEDGTLKRDENGLIEIPSMTDVRWIKRK